MSLDGREIDEPTLARALDRALDAYEAARKAATPAANATWFDLLTAAAFLIFAETQREWAVVEVGLGGRLDSTNIVDGEIAIVTNIELEHTEILGKTRAAIAREKVGVLKPGAMLITSLDAHDEAGRVLQARADELGSPVIRPPLGAAATIEDANVALAGAALDQLGEMGVRAPALGGPSVGGWLIDAETRAAARLPGRMERFDIDPGSRRVPVVLDGAHVPFNIRAVLRDLALTADLAGPCVAIVALAGDKDAAGFRGRTRQARLDHHIHRFAGIEPRPLCGRVAGARRVAWANERGRAGSEAGAEARPRTGDAGRRLAHRHRLALSHRGIAPGDRRGDEGPKPSQASPEPSTGFELIQVNHGGLSARPRASAEAVRRHGDKGGDCVYGGPLVGGGDG